MMYKTLLFLFFFMGCILQAQSPLDSLSVTEKIEYLEKNSNKYKEFKVVPKKWLLLVKEQVGDTLLANQKAFHEVKERENLLLAKHNKTLQDLEQTQAEKDAISQRIGKVSVFGIPIHFGFFQTIVYSLIVILLLLFLSSVVKSKKAYSTKKEALGQLQKMEEELEIFRKKSLEKEQQLQRKLQDEINKNKIK